MAPSFVSTLIDTYCYAFWRHLSAWEIPVFVVVSVAYVTNYVCRIAKKPLIVCNPKNPLNEMLQHRIPALQDKYWPTFWCYQAHFTTIFRSLFKGNPRIPYEAEVISTADGGAVKIDWVHNQDHPAFEDDRRPLVLFLPGISGASDENYILHLVKEAMEAGYRAAVFNYRGLGGLQLKTPRIYNSTNTEDLDLVVRHIDARFPEAPKFAVGCSLGGMLLFNYLSVECRGLTVGIDSPASSPTLAPSSTLAAEVDAAAAEKREEEEKDDEKEGAVAAPVGAASKRLASASEGKGCPFVAAMTISCVWDPFEASKSLEEPINWAVFNRTLKGNLCRTVARNREILSSKFDVDYVLASRTIRDFDERLTHRMFGYTTNEAYYRAAVLRDRLHQIRCCPLVCLNAIDDPFCPATSLPVAGAVKSDNVALVLTDLGGHIGFIEGLTPYGPNFADRLFRQIAQNVFAE